VRIARHTARPFALDYLILAFSDFVELHGDRLFGNDEAMPCGFANDISPEGCAAILWKHRSYAPEATEALKLTTVRLKELELIDEVIPEPLGGAHQDHELAAKNLRSALLEQLDQLTKKPIDALLDERYEKFRKMGKGLRRVGAERVGVSERSDLKVLKNISGAFRVASSKPGKPTTVHLLYTLYTPTRRYALLLS
jgi:acetyl-CoA carboxylase alpha subunit